MLIIIKKRNDKVKEDERTTICKLLSLCYCYLHISLYLTSSKCSSKILSSIIITTFLFVILAGTPYAGGLFRMKLVLGKNFPSEPPKGYFLTKIFHPNVASNGEICVNTLKKDWTADLGIKHLLLVSNCYLCICILNAIIIQIINLLITCL
jgi:hypothetical protein